MSSLKDQNHFVLMTETCKTQLVNKILKIEESYDQGGGGGKQLPIHSLK